MTGELYALGYDRSAASACAFLDRFGPNRESGVDEYGVPENSDDPDITFVDEQSLLAYLEDHPDVPYGLYWNDRDSDSLRQVMLFYTVDGGVILGVADRVELLDSLAEEVVAYTGASHALFGSEQRPPDSCQEFIRLCEGQDP